MLVPPEPKIYHIAHVDRLASIIADGFLWSDAEAQSRSSAGTKIGLNSIKRRRLHELKLQSHPDLYVGNCVPFYFCPRSVMLYLIHRGDEPELTYKGGQEPIIHLEADLRTTIGVGGLSLRLTQGHATSRTLTISTSWTKSTGKL